jgi:hypothetical protein
VTIAWGTPREVEAVAAGRGGPTAPRMATCPVCGGTGAVQNPWTLEYEDLECLGCQGAGQVPARWAERFLARWHLPVGLLDTIGPCAGCGEFRPTAPWPHEAGDDVDWCAACALGAGAQGAGAQRVEEQA